MFTEQSSLKKKNLWEKSERKNSYSGKWAEQSHICLSKLGWVGGNLDMTTTTTTQISVITTVNRNGESISNFRFFHVIINEQPHLHGVKTGENIFVFTFCS